MTGEEKTFFEALQEKRNRAFQTMSDISLRGVWSVVTDQYSAQAHFIYELLQNADDAGATRARFVLKYDELIFAHNGTRHFMISDPYCEDADSKSKTLGDINSITSVANSNKTENTIGKFGIGFKAVFQYTRTPHIYDKYFRFKLENYIVPVLLDRDHLERGVNETLFVFPFNNADINPADSEREIDEKLNSLVLPTLFLKHLERVDYVHGLVRDSYEKKINSRNVVNGIEVELLSMWQMNLNAGALKEPSQEFWLFTKSDRIDGYDVEYAVGFSIKHDKLAPADYNAFCFFPTKEKTGLNFIIHAPFLLTMSRANIRADKSFNRTLIQKLAELAVDALVILKGVNMIDDGILEIIPCDPNAFTAIDSNDQISFRPFFDEIKKAMQTKEILPTAFSKKYVALPNAYWAATSTLNQLFSNEQLRLLTGNPNAAWVFTSVSEKHGGDGAINRYIKDIVNESFNDEHLLLKLNADFIERQKIDWLRDLYSYLIDTEERMKRTRALPIFLDQDRKAAAAFDSNGRAMLFLPSDILKDYPTVHRDLIRDPIILQCLQKFGIAQPSLKDEIYNKILPRYRTQEAFEIRSDIRTFAGYYQKASFEERRQLIKELKGHQFLYARSTDGTPYRCYPRETYIHSDDLERYFEGAQTVYLIRLEDYAEYFKGKSELDDLKDFLREVGVADEAPRIIEHRLNDTLMIETRIEGCQEALQSITKTKDRVKSFVMWRVLSKLFGKRTIDPKAPHKTLYIEPIMRSSTRRSKKAVSTDIAALRQTPWLLDVNGQFRAPQTLDTSTLSKAYERKSEDADRLIRFLKIGDVSNLTPEQLRKIQLAEQIEQNFSDVEIKELIRRRKAANQKSSTLPSTNRTAQSERSDQSDHRSTVEHVDHDVDHDVEQRSPSKPVDYSKQISDLNSQHEKELQRLETEQQLSLRAESLEKYSYEWFTTLLELERLNDDSSDSRAISITFGRVERQPDTRRTLILKYPNRYIPSSIEELTDIKLKLSSRGEKIAEPVIDAISVKSFTLRVKLKDASIINSLDLSSIDEANITADSPAFLLDALISGINNLGFEPSFDMKTNLPSNIEFIFGPPGTGKTTYLAREILIPLMRNKSSARILVLTPTNKAADVIARRIVTRLEDINDQSYHNWLIRFVSTNDEFLEERSVVRDRTFDFTSLRRSVVVTTIHRFPYDYFMPSSDKRLYLNGIDWDYIVIDEASMITLAHIIFPLYKKTPTKFIIAGDPFQIEPIARAPQWQNENIYSMVELASFKEPSTVPQSYPIKLLTTQYRSIPTVGRIFSQFAYDGVLGHHRTSGSQRRIKFAQPFRTLNLLKFPVKRYESIYRAKRLKSGSLYQIYSALFTFELVNHLARSLAVRHADEKFSIGIITPYRAEGDLINKLTASMSLPTTVDIQVGTIHGFQGDECDIIFVVLNPPPFISDSDAMYLNKLNILNVAISRARDYVFVLMPDDQTANVEQLRLIKRLERLMKASGDCCEISTNELEQMMFGSTTFIEDNAFSTAHQDVNIYGSVERRYEIRSEDAAVDIQLHNIISAAPD